MKERRKQKELEEKISYLGGDIGARSWDESWNY
jgi:hypothetical protein